MFTEVLLPYGLSASPRWVSPSRRPKPQLLTGSFQPEEIHPRENLPGSPLFPAELPAQLLLRSHPSVLREAVGPFSSVQAHAFPESLGVLPGGSVLSEGHQIMRTQNFSFNLGPSVLYIQEIH